MNNFLISILSLSASGSLLALFLLAVKPLLKNKVSKSFFYYIWLIVLLRLVIPYSAPLNLFNVLFQVDRQNVEDITHFDPVQPDKSDEKEEKKIPDMTRSVLIFPVQPQDNTDDSINIPVMHHSNFGGLFLENIIWLWVAGAFGSIFRISLSYGILIQRLKRSFTTPHQDDVVYFKRLQNSGKIRLFCSEIITTPILTGVFRPVIVLPIHSYVQSGMERELLVILSHELTHYRRRDILYKWLVAIVTSLHWFNPLMLLIRKEIERACELACDESVIKNMSEDEKQIYGNTLIFLAANKKFNNSILAMSLWEDKKILKERLQSIMKFKRKSLGSIALMLSFAIIFTGCTATFNVFGIGKSNKDTPGTDNVQEQVQEQEQKSIDQQEQEQEQKTTDQQDDGPENSNTIYSLRALKSEDLYENGKLFMDIPESVIHNFEEYISTQTIPDMRKGKRALEISQVSTVKDRALLYLTSIPEQNIYLYGYYDIDNPPGYGLVLDIGDEQTIYTFPYRYMTNTMIPPLMGISDNKSKIYITCQTGSGTGCSISELYVFQTNHDQIIPYHVDTDELVNRLNELFFINYEPIEQKLSIYSGKKIILTERLTPFIGAFDSENLSPSSFFCGDFISYSQIGDSILVHWKPVFYAKDRPGARSTLYNLDSLFAELIFTYDHNGNITGFDIGEIMINQLFSGEGDVDGDGSLDSISVKITDNTSILSIALGNGNFAKSSTESSSEISWTSPYQLTTGDIDDDGKDEIIFTSAVFGSNYNAKDLHIFRMEQGKPVEMPQNYESDTTIEDISQKSLNDDTMCIDVSVIEENNRQFLRIRKLINPHENTARYIDVFWNGEAWQVKNVTIGPAYDD